MEIQVANETKLNILRAALPSFYIKKNGGFPILRTPKIGPAGLYAVRASAYKLRVSITTQQGELGA